MEKKLCSEGNTSYNKDINFNGECKKDLSDIKENDITAQKESASIIYDDIDWKQLKEGSGLVDGDDKRIFGSLYIPVEKMNEKTSAFLKTIANARTDSPIDYCVKPNGERWYASSIIWNVRDDISKKYDVRIEIEQGALYYRGTWIKVTVKAPYKACSELQKICRKFCKDYGLNQRKEISFVSPYDLPWPEGQKKREYEDDKTDYFFDSMD